VRYANPCQDLCRKHISRPGYIRLYAISVPIYYVETQYDNHGSADYINKSMGKHEIRPPPYKSGWTDHRPTFHGQNTSPIAMQTYNMVRSGVFNQIIGEVVDPKCLLGWFLPREAAMLARSWES